MSARRSPSVIFYTPFPDQTEGDYKQNFEKSKPKNHYIVRVNGVRFYFDPTTSRANWRNDDEPSYRKDVEDLEHFKQIQMAHFQEKLAQRYKEVPPTVIGEQFPLALDKKQKAEFFAKYNINDTLFIHSHGSPDVIGTGGFTQTPKMLAKHLQALGLSKLSAPIIVVWACNSGKPSDTNTVSYAKALRKELEHLKYPPNLLIIGFNAKITTNLTGVPDPVSFTRTIAIRGQKETTTVSERGAIDPNISTPIRPKKELSAGLWTHGDEHRIRVKVQSKSFDATPPKYTDEELKMTEDHSASLATAAPAKKKRKNLLYLAEKVHVHKRLRRMKPPRLDRSH